MKTKITFNHTGSTFIAQIGIEEKRADFFIQAGKVILKDIVKGTITTKSKALKKLLTLCNPQTDAELFLLGGVFAMIDEDVTNQDVNQVEDFANTLLKAIRGKKVD